MSRNARSKWLEQSNVAFDFHVYFWNQYGSRWKNLFGSLGDLHQVVGFCNPFAINQKIKQIGLDEYLGATEKNYHQQLSSIRIACGVSRHDKIKKDKNSNLKPYYWMDPASFLPPLLLDVHPSHRILDMCAAPGGKSLVIASLMFADFYKKNFTNIHFIDKLNDKFQSQQKFQFNIINYNHILQIDNNVEHLQEIGIFGRDKFKLQNSQNICQQQIQNLVYKDNFKYLNIQNNTSDSNTFGLNKSLIGNYNHNEIHNFFMLNNLENSNKFIFDQNFWNNEQKIGHLVCNDIDTLRSSRMEKIFREYIPYDNCLNKFISIGRKNGGRYWSRFEGDSFDRVLVDVPCTSERHVAQRAARERCGSIANDHWSFKMCSEHAITQQALLYAGMQCLKKGGRLVYSTCSLDKAQNDGVINNVLKKIKNQNCYEIDTVKIDTDLVNVFQAEFTDFGLQIFPDASGFGPLYICVMEKLR